MPEGNRVENFRIFETDRTLMNTINHANTKPTVAVIGAGMAGLAAGEYLKYNGYAVTIFEKARGSAGRSSTRRENEYQFDHGAQYFTVQDEAFRKKVEEWMKQDVVRTWDGQLVSIKSGSRQALSENTLRYVGVPGMNAMAKALAENLNISYQTRLQSIHRKDDRWQLYSDEKQFLGAFDIVIITAPPPQALPLLEMFPDWKEKIAQVEMQPCWAVMVNFAGSVNVPFDAAILEGSPLSWIARNGSKPRRPGGESWVLHGSATWSREHIEKEADWVSDALLNEFFTQLKLSRSAATFSKAHRWRYALATNPLKNDYLWDDQNRLGVAGDWLRQSRIEDAYLSGLYLAQRIIQSVG
jgi:renalase